MKAVEILEFVVCLILFGVLAIGFTSCEDSYVTVERRMVDAENNIPIYFQATAEQDGVNTWRPVFTYYIYQMEEGMYDAYFHAYLITDDSVAWSATEEIVLENGKKILGHYSGVNTAFIPGEDLGRTTPMAYVSIRHNE